jgi:hypothetical protein
MAPEDRPSNQETIGDQRVSPQPRRAVIAAARLIVLLGEIYFALGLAFAIVFAWRGAAAIDPAAREGTIGFRLLIVPGSALLWPLLLRRWVRRLPAPPEHNAHRDAALGRRDGAADAS